MFQNNVYCQILLTIEETNVVASEGILALRERDREIEKEQMIFLINLKEYVSQSYLGVT